MTIIYTRADGTNCSTGNDVPYMQAKAVLDSYNAAQTELEQYKAEWEKYFPALSFKEVDLFIVHYRDRVQRLTIENMELKSKLTLQVTYAKTADDFPHTQYVNDNGMIDTGDLDDAQTATEAITRKCIIADVECKSQCNPLKCKNGKDGVYLKPISGELFPVTSIAPPLQDAKDALPVVGYYGVSQSGYEVIDLKENKVLRMFDALEITAEPVCLVSDALNAMCKKEKNDN